jgi:putative transposase
MDANVMEKAGELAKKFAGQATTLDELNGVMRSMMKSVVEGMLNTELEVHLGRGSNLAASVVTNEDPEAPKSDESARPRNR